ARAMAATRVRGGSALVADDPLREEGFDDQELPILVAPDELLGGERLDRPLDTRGRRQVVTPAVLGRVRPPRFRGKRLQERALRRRSVIPDQAEVCVFRAE